MLSYFNFGIGDVVAGTTLITIFEDIFTQTEVGSICLFRLTISRFISLAPSVGNDIFRFIFENVVSINFYVQMEPNLDSAALAQQVQALAATIEELTKQNQEMKLRLQQVQ